MADDIIMCHDCDEVIETWSEFTEHASAGHAIHSGPCFGDCLSGGAA